MIQINIKIVNSTIFIVKYVTIYDYAVETTDSTRFSIAFFDSIGYDVAKLRYYEGAMGLKVENRRNDLANLVDRDGQLSFARIKAAFPTISEMTLRTDLKALDAQGRIVRVYGGAKSVENVVRADDLFYKKAGRNMEQKKQIAAKALPYIKRGATIFLDCGTTMMQLASLIPDEPMYIVTNSISCAQELARLTSPEVKLLGGKLNRFNLSTVDVNNKRIIDKLNFDIAFLAVTGFTLEYGFTCGTEVDDELRHRAIRRADRVIALMDSSKVGRSYPVTYAKPEDVDILISDDQLDQQVASEFTRRGKIVL